MDKPQLLGAYRFEIKDNELLCSEILISRTLFYNASASIFTNTLLHEMTHQYVVEFLGLPQERHGKAWKDACKMSGAKPLAKESSIIKENFSPFKLKKYKQATRDAKKTLGGNNKMIKWYHLEKNCWIEGLCVKKYRNQWLFISLDKKEIKWYLLHPKFLYETSPNSKYRNRLTKIVPQLNLETD